VEANLLLHFVTMCQEQKVPKANRAEQIDFDLVAAIRWQWNVLEH